MKSLIFTTFSVALLQCWAFSNATEAAFTAEEKQAIAQIKAYNTAFKAIAREVTPSVVTIDVTQKVDADEQRRPRGRNFPFFQFPEEQQDRQSTGSGIVMTANGYILTNHHVAGEADKLTVIFSDNQEYDAELVGSDPHTDIAVIKIDAKNLKPATVGKSDNLEIGEWVLAIGAPLNLESTVTAGIVSAIGRDIQIFRDSFGVEDFIQTDAAINPGNSGGALVNLNGEIIGINTAIASRGGSFIGYGFAVPIDLAKKVMDDIIKHGEVKRGYLGVALEEVDAGKASAFGLDRPQGVLISQVGNNTPAERAGLKSGDIILTIEGQQVNRPNQVQSLIARKHPDDIVMLGIRREEKNLNIPATLGESLPKEMLSRASTPEPEEDQSSATELGITVHDITAELTREFGLPDDAKGVLVVDVSRGPAREAGFSNGDVIFGVRQRRLQQDIETVNDFENALAKLQKGQYAAFSINRNGVPRFMPVRIPE